MDVEIRMMPADAAQYREIRLEGLKCYETESVQPLSRFSERLASSAVFGAFRGPELLGIAGFAVRNGIKEAHKGPALGHVRPTRRKKRRCGAAIGRRGNRLCPSTCRIASTERRKRQRSSEASLYPSRLYRVRR